MVYSDPGTSDADCDHLEESIPSLKLPAEPTGSNAAANSRRSLLPFRYLDQSSIPFRN
jgi:hypothetical protein